MRSIIAARIAALELDEYVPAEIEDALAPIYMKTYGSKSSQAEFAESVRGKIAKYHRVLSRHIDAENERKKLGFPTQD